MNEHRTMTFIGEPGGNSIIIDNFTGLPIDPAPSAQPPTESITDPGAQYEAAVRLVEFAHRVRPRQKCSGVLLEAARMRLAGGQQADLELVQLGKRFANLAMTASWLGVKVCDPSAGTCMAAFALTKPPAEALKDALRNVGLMVMLAENRGDKTLRPEFEELLGELVLLGADESLPT